jgi:hypothetical protein
LISFDDIANDFLSIMKHRFNCRWFWCNLHRRIHGPFSNFFVVHIFMIHRVSLTTQWQVTPKKLEANKAWVATRATSIGFGVVS